MSPIPQVPISTSGGVGWGSRAGGTSRGGVGGVAGGPARGGGDTGLLTAEQQVCVHAVHHLGHGLGVVADVVPCGTDRGTRQWKRARWRVSVRPSPGLPGPLTHHLSSPASRPRAALAVAWQVLAGRTRAGEGQDAQAGQAGGSRGPAALLTYEERSPGLDVVVAAVQVAEGLRQVDAELLLAVGHLAGRQRALLAGAGTSPEPQPSPAPASPGGLRVL